MNWNYKWQRTFFYSLFASLCVITDRILSNFWFLEPKYWLKKLEQNKAKKYFPVFSHNLFVRFDCTWNHERNCQAQFFCRQSVVFMHRSFDKQRKIFSYTMAEFKHLTYPRNTKALIHKSVLHLGPFLSRCFYTEIVFTHRFFFKQTLLHRFFLQRPGTFTQALSSRDPFTHRLNHKQTLFTTDASPQTLWDTINFKPLKNTENTSESLPLEKKKKK